MRSQFLGGCILLGATLLFSQTPDSQSRPEPQQTPPIAHIPVLLLTAKVQGVDQRRFAGLGLAGILFKPFDPLTLAEQISTALGWKD